MWSLAPTSPRPRSASGRRTSGGTDLSLVTWHTTALAPIKGVMSPTPAL